LLKETGRSASSLISLKKKGIIQESEEIVEREAYEDDFTDSIETAHESISLTLEQQTAIQAINDDLKSKKFKAHLLNGVTGSGKTEVYFEAMELALSQNGSVLFLVPGGCPCTTNCFKNKKPF
jgi:primosomal protein N' (replication factor Y)